MTEVRYTTVLFLGIAISLGAIVLATLARYPQAAIAFGIAPLVFYHYFLWRSATRGLSQDAIDSVYYFGFLVTVAALAASAVHVYTSLVTPSGSSTTPSFAVVALQFGLGLLATGYAVVARIHLTSVGVASDQRDPQIVVDEYLRKMREFVAQLDLAVAEFKRFADTTRNEAEQSIRRVQVSSEGAMVSAAQTFTTEIRGAISDYTSALSQLRAVITGLADDLTQTQVAQHFRDTARDTLQLNQALDALRRESTLIASDWTGLRRASLEVTDKVDKFGHILGEVAGPKGALAQYASTVSHAKEALTAATNGMTTLVGLLAAAVDSARGAAEDLTQVRDAVRDISPSLRSLKTATKAFAAAATALQSVAESLGNSTSELSALGASAQVADSHIREFVGESEGLRTSLGQVREELELVASLCRSMPPLVAAITETSETLEHIGEALSHCVRELDEGARGSKATAANLVELATACAEAVGRVRSAQGAFAVLEESLGHLTGRLGTSGSIADESLRKAAEQLRENAQVSTLAVDKLTQDMARMVEYIIERTRDTHQSR